MAKRQTMDLLLACTGGSGAARDGQGRDVVAADGWRSTFRATARSFRGPRVPNLPRHHPPPLTSLASRTTVSTRCVRISGC
ncbi:hypothetical protein FOA52_004468 [Chlamydomonas sp. UWO 241]|nr:hypothetical protein FOA52_004468 [Chlamydomonas sp. UWO 241]